MVRPVCVFGRYRAHTALRAAGIRRIRTLRLPTGCGYRYSWNRTVGPGEMRQQTEEFPWTHLHEIPMRKPRILTATVQPVHPPIRCRRSSVLQAGGSFPSRRLVTRRSFLRYRRHGSSATGWGSWGTLAAVPAWPRLPVSVRGGSRARCGCRLTGSANPSPLPRPALDDMAAGRATS